MMNDKELEIFNILGKITKLNSDIYSSLLKDYNEKLVNQVIEKMIDMSEDNYSKFDYYISNVQWVDEVVTKTLFEAYSIDLKSLRVFSSDESKKFAIELNEIVVNCDITIRYAYQVIKDFVEGKKKK